jgi:hypothetical protein
VGRVPRVADAAAWKWNVVRVWLGGSESLARAAFVATGSPRLAADLGPGCVSGLPAVRMRFPRHARLVLDIDPAPTEPGNPCWKMWSTRTLFMSETWNVLYK